MFSGEASPTFDLVTQGTISKEMNNNNVLNMNSMSKLSGWLHYWSSLLGFATVNVQQNEQPLFTKLKAMRMLRVLFVAQPLTNAHDQSVIFTQLFASKLTNQN